MRVEHLHDPESRQLLSSITRSLAQIKGEWVDNKRSTPLYDIEMLDCEMVATYSGVMSIYQYNKCVLVTVKETGKKYLVTRRSAFGDILIIYKIIGEK